MHTTYFVVEALVEVLLTKVAKLNKRAAKHSLPVIDVLVHRDKARRSYAQENSVVVPVTLKGTNPTVSGDWEMVAYLRNVRGGEAMTVRHLTEDYRVPANLKNGTHCDHCQTSRYRKFVAVLRSKADGQVKKIGSTCLQDFLPRTSIHSKAHWDTLEAYQDLMDEAANMDEADEEKFRSYGVTPPKYMGLTDYLAHVAMAIRQTGEFVSRSKNRELEDRKAWDKTVVVKIATADIAYNSMNEAAQKQGERSKIDVIPEADRAEYAAFIAKLEREGDPTASTHRGVYDRGEILCQRAAELDSQIAKLSPTPEDYRTAKAAITFADTLKTWDRPTDYIANLIAVVCDSGDILEKKHIGLAASLVTLRQRELDRAAREAAKAAKGESKYFGEIKKREVYTLTVQGIHMFDGAYGITYLYRFVDGDNNTAVWFSSKDANMKKGNTYQVKGTVKDHKLYNGTKQTVLTRCQVLNG